MYTYTVDGMNYHVDDEAQEITLSLAVDNPTLNDYGYKTFNHVNEYIYAVKRLQAGLNPLLENIDYATIRVEQVITLENGMKCTVADNLSADVLLERGASTIYVHQDKKGMQLSFSSPIVRLEIIETLANQTQEIETFKRIGRKWVDGNGQTK